MIVIADTSPINYLAKTGYGEVLRELYGTVLVPPAVRRELNHPRTPAEVRQWLAPWPAWLQMASVPLIVRPELLVLGAGESEAIALALQKEHSQLLMDDADGRHTAEARGLPVLGTVGILRDAAREKSFGSADSYQTSQGCRTVCLGQGRRCSVSAIAHAMLSVRK